MMQLRAGLAFVSILGVGCALDSAGGGSAATLGGGTEGSTSAAETGADGSSGATGQVVMGPRKRLLEIAPTAIEGLSGAALLVLLDADRIEYEDTLPGGADLRFVDASQSVMLPHEIESWDPSGVSAVWVRLPEGGAAEIWMYYADPDDASAAEPTKVWGPQHLAVWHMSDASAPLIEDATVSDHDAELLEAPGGAFVEGIAGQALSLSGGADRVQAPTLSPALSNAITLEAWVRMDALEPSENRFVISKRDSYHLSAVQPNLAQPRAQVRLQAGVTIEAGPSSSLSTTWSYVAVTYDSVMRVLSVYIDGRRVGLKQPDIPAGQSPLIAGSDYPLELGRRLQGTLDEVRISNVVRSEKYIEAQFESMSDQVLTFGEPIAR